MLEGEVVKLPVALGWQRPEELSNIQSEVGRQFGFLRHPAAERREWVQDMQAVAKEQDDGIRRDEGGFGASRSTDHALGASDSIANCCWCTTSLGTVGPVGPPPSAEHSSSVTF